MRQTYQQLIQTSQDFFVDDTTSSTNGITDPKTFAKNEINKAVGFIYSRIRGFQSEQLPKTMTTTADQIYYHKPPMLRTLHTATMSVGNVDYPLEVVESQAMWNKLQMVEYAASTIPKYIFVRRDDIGIYPTPQDAYTVTLDGWYEPAEMTVDTDYIDGTVDITQNTLVVTGTNTTFTSSMVGRWLRVNGSGSWYRIASFTDANTIGLETYFEEATVSGASYQISESPDIDTELHEYIPYRVAGVYYSTLRRDPVQGQAMLNFFYTGDFNNPRRDGGVRNGILGYENRLRTRGRNNSQLVRAKKETYDRFKETWTTQLTDPT